MNHAHLNYGTNVSTVLALAKPSSLFVNDYATRRDAVWQEVRARGGIVLTYLNLLNVDDPSESDLERDWFMGNPANVPSWGKNELGQWRSNWAGTRMIDIRPNSPWIPHMEDRFAAIITERLSDGAFFDSHGSRPWSKLAAWDTWPVAEQAAWTLGCVDTARRADVIRRQLNERFQIVHNGNWALPTSHPAFSAALRGYEYCDGVCIEHAEPTQPFHVAMAARTFNDLKQRRVVVIANNTTEALQWSRLPGVTHVASVDKTLGQKYQQPPPPVEGISPEDIRLAETTAYAARLKAERDALRAQGGQDDGRVEELEAQLASARSDLSAAQQELAAAVQRESAVAVALAESEQRLATIRDAWRNLSGGLAA